MSDESKIARPGQQDEAPDEVEGHGKMDRPGVTDESKIARPGETEEGDDVEAHGKFDAPKSDGKMV
jgi:hypothetical protein